MLLLQPVIHPLLESRSTCAYIAQLRTRTFQIKEQATAAEISCEVLQDTSARLFGLPCISNRPETGAPYLLPFPIHAHGTFGSAARAPTTTRSAARHGTTAIEEAANAVRLCSCEAAAPCFLLCPQRMCE